MQRLHSNDLVGYILQNTFGDIDKWVHYKVEIIDEEKRVSLWEEFYPYADLMKIKQNNSSYYYSQFQQNPIIKGGNIFKTSWIKYISRDIINNIQFEKYFITVDTALKDKEKNDFTVYSAFGVFENRLYYLDMFRGKQLS